MRTSAKAVWLVAVGALGLVGGDAFATCPAGGTSCSISGFGNVCGHTSGSPVVHCWLTIGSTPPSGNGNATTIYGNCGSDDYCIWGATEAGAPFCCSYTDTAIDTIIVTGGAGDDTINFQFDSFDLENAGDQPIVEGVAEGLGGNDTILGSRLVGRHYSDHLYGGTGDDTIDGSDGPDFIYGDDHNDTLLGGNGMDYIEGGIGGDTIRGQAGDDTVYGGSGQDLISGGTGADALYGEADGDVICANTGGSSTTHEVIQGGSGPNDNLWGGGSYTDITGHASDCDYCGNYGTQLYCDSMCDSTLTSAPSSCPSP